MLRYLERQTTLTGNQRRIIAVGILGDMLEFFDYFLIGYVVAFIAGPWKLTFGQSAIILLSSGFGAMFGAFFYGRLADRIGRRKVFIATVVTFSLGTGALTFTPDRAWGFLAVMRFLVGFGVGGLYVVILPLVQEFVGASKRGRISGLVTSAVPVGNLLGALLGATITPIVGWRGLFAIGALPAALTLLVLKWVPESPRWLIQQGRFEEARRSLAWALEMNPADLPLTAPVAPQPAGRMRDLIRYPRSLAVSWIINLGAQTGAYGFNLWAPTLLVLVLKVAPARAAFLMIWVTLAAVPGRLAMSFMSDALGRRRSGAIDALGSALLLLLAALSRDTFVGGVSVFWLLLIVTSFFIEGNFAIVGPYSAELWPSTLRTTGMGSAYGFGGLGKIIGPLGLAMIVGSSNVVTPMASPTALVPAYAFLAGWYVITAFVFLAFGYETRGRSLEAIDADLAAQAGPARPAVHID